MEYPWAQFPVSSTSTTTTTTATPTSTATTPAKATTPRHLRFASQFPGTGDTSAMMFSPAPPASPPPAAQAASMAGGMGSRPKKRLASEELFRDQRLAKRLETLSLRPRSNRRRLSIVAENVQDEEDEDEEEEKKKKKRKGEFVLNRRSGIDASELVNCEESDGEMSASTAAIPTIPTSIKHRSWLTCPSFSVHRSTTTTSTTAAAATTTHPKTPPPRPSRRDLASSSAAPHMEVDPSPHTIYISSLDAELSEAESDDDLYHGSSLQTAAERAQTRGKLVFIPDIEREMTRIPDHVLRTGEDEDRKEWIWEREREREREWERRGKELVLYSHTPETLGGGHEAEGTRRVIWEHRQRARRRLEEERKDAAAAAMVVQDMVDEGPGVEDVALSSDGDAMMLDDDGDVDMDA